MFNRVELEMLQNGRDAHTAGVSKTQTIFSDGQSYGMGGEVWTNLLVVYMMDVK